MTMDRIMVYMIISALLPFELSITGNSVAMSHRRECIRNRNGHITLGTYTYIVHFLLSYRVSFFSCQVGNLISLLAFGLFVAVIAVYVIINHLT